MESNQSRVGFALGFTAAAFALITSLASASAEPAPTLDDLDGKLRLLERKLELKEEEEEKQRTGNATVTAGKDGFSLIAADKESVLKFRFFQQIDGRAFLEKGDDQRLANTLLLRRVRPILEGSVGKYYHFRFMPEFAGTAAILDAYAEIAYWPEARLRIGRSKTPFGLERLKSAADMDLIEFAHPTSLTPNYDLGISLLGDFGGDAFSYYVSVFNGGVDGANRDSDINDEQEDLATVAWSATVSYLVTGESPSFKGLKPRHSVGFGGKRGFGALELIARASQLQADTDAFPVFSNPNTTAQEAFTYSGGVNWYLSRYAKLSAEYALTGFQGGAAAGADRPEERVFFGRLQAIF